MRLNRKTWSRFKVSILYKVVAINLIPIFLLGFAAMYIGEHRKNLVSSELESLKIQAAMLSSFISENVIENREQSRKTGKIFINDKSQNMIKKLSDQTMVSSRVYDLDGNLIIDSGNFPTVNTDSEIYTLSEPSDKKITKLHELLQQGIVLKEDIANSISDLVYGSIGSSSEDTKISSANQGNIEAAILAFSEEITGSAYIADKKDEILLLVSTPIITDSKIAGMLMLAKDDRNISYAVNNFRNNMIELFLNTFFITLVLSVYFATTIAGPLRKLAKTAETIKNSHNFKAEIPDMGMRNDEIGELSRALKHMTESLMERMDSIDKFAADVAHELKNPLSSLRSAVETASVVKDREKTVKLLSVMNHDLARLDRLITDISSASRLDSELYRESFEEFDLVNLLDNIVRSYIEPAKNLADTLSDIDIEQKIVIKKQIKHNKIMVEANPNRIVQVFTNLVDNALSFSPEDEVVTIFVRENDKNVIVDVIDKGPGVPSKNRDSIFERFYTERPSYEQYGTHSGLGLSIAKQIIENAKGSISLSDSNDDSSNKGACFTVELPKAK